MEAAQRRKFVLLPSSNTHAVTQPWKDVAMTNSKHNFATRLSFSFRHLRSHHWRLPSELLRNSVDQFGGIALSERPPPQI